MNPIYHTITGRAYDLEQLNQEERLYLTAVLEWYRESPEWSAFSAKWSALFDETSLDEASPTYRICQDLEARIGIQQGAVSPPDYRDYLVDLIEERYGSRYRFCKETGVDPGHLSRVLAGRAELSIESLRKHLGALEAVIVIRPKQEVSKVISPEVAAKELSRLQPT